MINEIVAACDVDLAQELPADIAALDDRRPLRAHARAGAAHHGTRGRDGAGEDARGAARGSRRRRPCRRSASPAPAAPARARSPTSSSAASASTSRTGCGSRSISIDPSRRKSGGALLGDRIRMNAIEHPNIYMRSLATREAGSEVARRCPTRSPPARSRASTSSSSRPPASARATRRSCRSSTCRST